MKIRIIVCAALLPALLFAGTQAWAGDKDGKEGLTYKWSRAAIDASRTGVRCPRADNVPEALGTVSGRTYYAPSGRVFKGGSTPKAAKVLTRAQTVMAPVKKVVARSSAHMAAAYPESALSNWFVDKIMDAVEKASGRTVDVGILNFGGIRTEMPEGDVLLDDIMSMFPFKNKLVYVGVKGDRLLEILSTMAATRFQVLGGVRVVAQDGKLVSAEIDGAPIDPEKVYGMATITFLLHGGDDLRLGEGMEEVVEYPVEIFDAMIESVQEDAAAGKEISYQKDGRVKIL